MKITYFQTTDGYAAVTTESPSGFKGVLFVGRGPENGKIVEQAFAIAQMKSMTQVPKDDVPAEWVLRLGYEQPIIAEPVLDTDDTLLDLMPEPVSPLGRTFADLRPDEKRNYLIVLAISVALACWLCI